MNNRIKAYKKNYSVKKIKIEKQNKQRCDFSFLKAEGTEGLEIRHYITSRVISYHAKNIPSSILQPLHSLQHHYSLLCAVTNDHMTSHTTSLQKGEERNNVGRDFKINQKPTCSKNKYIYRFVLCWKYFILDINLLITKHTTKWMKWMNEWMDSECLNRPTARCACSPELTVAPTSGSWVAIGGRTETTKLTKR